MNPQDISQIIRSLFREHFASYPGSYPLDSAGLPTREADACARQVAGVYWATRTESEIKRDKQARITELNYIQWVFTELNYLTI